jgi:hypothetical protein
LDRDRLFAGVVANQAVFGSYQRRTKRVIPIVEVIRKPCGHGEDGLM